MMHAAIGPADDGGRALSRSSAATSCPCGAPGRRRRIRRLSPPLPCRPRSRSGPAPHGRGNRQNGARRAPGPGSPCRRNRWPRSRHASLPGSLYPMPPCCRRSAAASRPVGRRYVPPWPWQAGRPGRPWPRRRGRRNAHGRRHNAHARRRSRAGLGCPAPAACPRDRGRALASRAAPETGPPARLTPVRPRPGPRRLLDGPTPTAALQSRRRAEPRQRTRLPPSSVVGGRWCPAGPSRRRGASYPPGTRAVPATALPAARPGEPRPPDRSRRSSGASANPPARRGSGWYEPGNSGLLTRPRCWVRQSRAARRAARGSPYPVAGTTAVRRSPCTPRRLALPFHRPGGVRAVTSLAFIRWPGPAGHAGCVTHPCHAHGVAGPCREHTTKRGGSTHNSDRPRPRRPGTRHIRWPSQRVLAIALPGPRSARVHHHRRR